MATFSPVDYGGKVGVDDSGSQALARANEENAASNLSVARDVTNIAGNAGLEITKGVLHTQTLKATAALKAQQADIINFIEQHPTVSKDDLQQYMSQGDYEAWHASLSPEDRNSDKVPMYKVAGDLFNSASRKARETAGQLIGPLSMRRDWTDTAALEAATTKESRVDRIAAGQMVADQRAQTMGAFDDMLNKAVTPRDVDDAIAGISGSPWLHPAERKAAKEKGLKVKDSLAADHAMRASDITGMKAELIKLEKPDAAQSYQHLEEKERLALANQLRTHIKAAEAEDNHADTIIEKWKKQQDHETFGFLIDRISKGDVPSMASVLNQRKFAGMYQDPNVARRGYFDSETQIQAFHLLEGYWKSQKTAKEVSDPAAMRALTDYFVKDPDGFTKDMLSNKPFTYKDSFNVTHQLNPTEQLTTGDFNKMLGYVKDWKDPVRARAEELHAQEASKDALSLAIMHNMDPTNKSGLFDATTEAAARRAELQVRMEDAVREATKPGQPLEPIKRRKVMEDAADIFIKNPVNKTSFFRSDKYGQLEVQLKDGDYKVPPTEMTDLKLGAKESGLTNAGQFTPEAFAQRIREYHDNYQEAIDKVYRQFNGGQPPTGAQAYRVYFEALKNPVAGTAEVQVRRALMRMKQEEAAKSGQR